MMMYISESHFYLGMIYHSQNVVQLSEGQYSTSAAIIALLCYTFTV